MESKDINKLTRAEIVGKMRIFEQGMRSSQLPKLRSIAFTATSAEEPDEDLDQLTEMDKVAKEISLIAQQFKKILDRRNKRFKKIGEPKTTTKPHDRINRPVKTEEIQEADVQCYKCRGFGHVSSICPNQKSIQRNSMAATLDDSSSDNNSSDSEQEEEKSNSLYAEIKEDQKGNSSFWSQESCLVTLTQQHKISTNDWVLDSGCSNHMTGECTWFTHFDEYQNSITLGDGTTMDITGKGTVNILHSHFISDVWYVEGLTYNLLSISQICAGGYHVMFTENFCK